MIFKRKLFKYSLFIILSVCFFYFFYLYFMPPSEKMRLDITLESPKDDYFQVYFLIGNEELSEEQSVVTEYKSDSGFNRLKFPLDLGIKSLRFDVGTNPGEVIINEISICSFFQSYPLNLHDVNLENSHDIENIIHDKGNLKIVISGGDPYLELVVPQDIKDQITQDNKLVNQGVVLILALLTTFMMLLVIKLRSDIAQLVKELFINKKMLYFLSLNDFKTKYTGSYLGIVWAFVQPIVTVFIYWFVFEIGFRSGPVQSVPFILWLIAGIVPWFFLAEAWGSATNSLVEYSYLVKKIVFHVRLLPFVKITSAFFVHVFFVILTFLIFVIYGIDLSIHSLQVLYYSFSAICFVFSISLITSSLIVFFKDLGHIIGLILQFGMWLTPILWNPTMIPESYRWILKINPAYYVVEGYRDALINRVWFWERYNQTSYFWILTLSLFLIGTIIMKKTKPHFADVL
ncbi:ABC transporter permease [Paenibacillus lactis]|uniref:ABC transporter permease n=1 Tax=Paenibacillus lactis TaxID=228574 RepID=UPI00368D9CA5